MSCFTKNTILFIVLVLSMGPCFALNDGAGSEFFSSNLGIRTMPRAGSALDVNGTIISNGFQLTSNIINGGILTANATGVGTWTSFTAGATNIDGLSDAAVVNNSIFLGSGAGAANTSGTTYSTGLGYNALNANSTGLYNSAFGYLALQSNISGNSNTAVGYSALANSTAGSNSAVGSSAMIANTTGSQNTAVGSQALNSNIDGNQNTAIGNSALRNNTSGIQNSALGYQALFNNTGSYNVAVGSQALINNATGINNTAVGTYALYYADNGSNYNTAVGFQAGEGTPSNEFSNGTFLGYQTGIALTTGDNNILIGYKAGENINSGSSNIVIGYDIDAPLPAGNNQLSIGNLIYGTGVDGINTTLSTGNIGIGTSSPAAKLDVNGAIKLGTTSTCTEGTQRYDPTTNGMQFCNNAATWISMGTSTGSLTSWTLVAEENFPNTTATGWSTTTTSICVTGHRILGGYNVLGNGINVSKTFSSLPTHTKVMVRFNYYSLDSWDNESAWVAFDGQIVWRATLDQLDDERTALCGGSQNDVITSGEAIFDHSASSVTVQFGSSLNEATTNESFGVDNVEIWVR